MSPNPPPESLAPDPVQLADLDMLNASADLAPSAVPKSRPLLTIPERPADMPPLYLEDYCEAHQIPEPPALWEQIMRPKRLVFDETADWSHLKGTTDGQASENPRDDPAARATGIGTDGEGLEGGPV